MAVEYYDMRHEGAQIDDAVDLVLSGDIIKNNTSNAVTEGEELPVSGDAVFKAIEENGDALNAKIIDLREAVDGKVDKVTGERLITEEEVAAIGKNTAAIKAIDGKYLAATPSGDPNHMLYLDAGFVWNAETNYWEYGGIVNITTDELRKAWLEAYTLQGGTYLIGWFRQSLSRINICRARWSSVDSIQRMFELANTLEVAVLADKGRTALPSIIDSAFYGCRKLKSISTPLNMQYCKTASSAFVSCFELKDVIINNLKISLELADSSRLSKSSLLNLIQKSAPATAITIKVHADVYAWASTDAEIQAALSAQPLVTLISA